MRGEIGQMAMAGSSGCSVGVTGTILYLNVVCWFSETGFTSAVCDATEVTG